MGTILGIFYFISDNKIIFYDLCIHFIAIGFIGITIVSYLPMMLPPIIGRKLNFLMLNNIPLILIIISLFLRTLGMVILSFNNVYLFHIQILSSFSGFLGFAAMIVFIIMIYRSIEK